LACTKNAVIIVPAFVKTTAGKLGDVLVALLLGAIERSMSTNIFGKIITLLLFFLIFLSCVEQAVEHEGSNYVNIPDNIFKGKLLKAGFDINDDGEISYSEAKMIDSLYIAESDPTSSNPKINDITGIEAFTNLEYFNCYDNSITGEIDLSHNIKLVYLNIGVNNINNLILHNLTQLRELYST
jgi:hypothetical protein